jgi:nonribosomal peptide synthetase DhbF
MTNIGVIDEREMRLPLSAAQLGVWFAHKIDPANPIYNIGQSIEIHGPVDPSLFNAAVTQAAADTEAYRVRFIEEIDGPRQIIGPPSEISIPLLDVSAELDPQAAAEAWMKADLANPVDLLRDPLFRFALFKAAPARFFWYQRYHHVLIDGFGVVLFKRRVADIYTALVNKLPCSGNPFGSLAVLLEEDASYRASERFARDRRYWLEYLADRPEPVSLSGRPATNCSCFLRQTAYLPPSSAETLRSVAHRARAGLPQLIVAATALYLHRLTSAQDLVLGLPVTGRLGAVSRRTPGMLSNVLPLRLTVHPGMSLSQLIEKVAEHVRRGLLHQRYRTEDLGRDLGLLAHDQKLFGTSINVMAFDHELLFAGHRTTARNLSNGPVQDLSIVVDDRSNSNELRIDFDANPALYRADELASHQQRFLRLLEAIAADPGQRIGRLELLEPEERRQILVDWNDTACGVSPTTLPALFEAQVERSPEATALVFEESALTYAQLNAQANRLAHFLIGEGIGPEDLVGLALPRSAEMVVGLLAILKAGAAYLPLDPNYPADRLDYMLQDAQPACLITISELAETFPERVVRLVLDQGETVITLSRQPQSNPTDLERRQALQPSNPAYVTYTSGSTGTPKGVVVTHAGIPALAGAQVDRLRLTPRSRVLQFASLSFDASFWEIVMALTTGAALVLLRDEARRGMPLREMLVTQGVTHALLPPVVLATLEHGDSLPLQGLIVGGEACPGELVARWSPGRCMVNAYGPTEITVCATISAPLSGSQTPPIGSPIWNTRVYVLDASLQPVPVGVKGELYIAGAGLGRGYLGRPDLSAERFVADLYGPPGTRMYRTSDMARWRSEGVLDFLGPADHQVKIRGFRIEPGEIEAVLLSHPTVAQASVIAREDRPGDKRLVGYVVPASGRSTDPATLRAHLGQSLPDYMVPAAIVLLEALPLTPIGKLDRKALPAPDFTATASARRAPRTSQEELLCALFAETLGLPRVGIEDNFFALGGDSISSIELVSRARQAGLLITPRDIFQHQSVVALVAMAGAVHKTNAAPSDIGIGPLPLTPIMRWLLERGGSIGGFSQSMLLQVGAQLTEDQLIGAVQALLDHHDALRLRLVGAGESIGAWGLEIAPPGAIRAAACVRRIDVSALDELARQMSWAVTLS